MTTGGRFHGLKHDSSSAHPSDHFLLAYSSGLAGSMSCEGSQLPHRQDCAPDPVYVTPVARRLPLSFFFPQLTRLPSYPMLFAKLVNPFCYETEFPFSFLPLLSSPLSLTFVLSKTMFPRSSPCSTLCYSSSRHLDPDATAVFPLLSLTTTSCVQYLLHAND